LFAGPPSFILSDKSSRLNPRHVVPKRGQAHEPKVPVKVALRALKCLAAACKADTNGNCDDHMKQVHVHPPFFINVRARIVSESLVLSLLARGKVAKAKQ
jgi:hypothetical protein